MENVLEDEAMKEALFEAIAITGKALSSARRLELLDLLAQGERNVEALARAAGLGLKPYPHIFRP